MASSQSRAVQRLLRDLKELQDHPLTNVSAQPLEDNLLVWHVNIRGNQSPLSECVFHLVITFSEEYPIVPPSVDLFTSLPHANVFPGKYGKQNHICMDMLEEGSFSDESSKNRPYTGWSSSYSVLSLLTQLEAFLMQENMHYGSHITLDNAIAEAHKFKCPSCPHTGTKPFPPLEKASSLAKRKIVVRKPHVIVPSLLDLQKTPSKKTITSTVQPSNEPSTASLSQVKETEKSEKKKTPKQHKEKNINNDKDKTTPKPQEEEWQVVVSKKKRNKVQDDFGFSKKPSAPLFKATDWKNYVNPPVVPSESQEKKQKNKSSMKEKLKEIEPPKPKRIVGDYELSKSQKKKLAQKKKKQQKFEKETKENVLNGHSDNISTKEKSDDSESTKTEKAAPKAQKEEELAFSKPKTKKNHNTTLEEMVEIQTHSNQQTTYSPGKGDLVLLEKENVNRKPMIGDFSKLPYEILLEILTFLSPKDIGIISMTCKDMKLIAEDGFLWKSLFSKYYPASSLTAKNIKDWKFVFMCEVNNILEDLICFHTKRTFEEDVLGIPLEFTVNPKTEKIDYIYSTMDLLSWEAFYYDKVRKTAWKETFTHWLPLYITQDHFQRALPLLKKTFLQLCPHYGTNTFQPEMALEILSKLMNTQCVLLMDKGIHVSSKALDGYLAIHRLMIAFVIEYPQLSTKIDSQISQFLQSPSKRSKRELPALGEFLPLLSVSRKYTWFHISKYFLEETFDRNVIWICRTYPGLANNLDGKEADFDRLNKSFEAVHVSLRLLMFHVYFLTQFARPNGGHVPLELVALDYDRFYGRPSHQMREKFQDHVKKILETKAWYEFFRYVCYPCPNPTDLTNWLRQAVRNSKKKGYHSDNTNFSAIQRSGVSKILLKGESYTASPTLKNVLLEEVWSWPQNTIYLDASCLVFNNKHEHFASVDYSQTVYHNGAITHSGDVLDYTKKEGHHTIRIDLSKLPSEVNNLYLTITAFTTTLKEIKRPYIRFTDADLDQELCRYDLEQTDTGNHTAVVMAKLCRPDPKQPWRVLALGEICEGRASNYGPLVKTIKEKFPNKH